jgi:hypothetical protein
MNRYCVVNLVHKASMRNVRAKSGKRPRRMQRLLGNTVRLYRDAFCMISEKQLKEHWKELSQKQHNGIIAVRLGDKSGSLVDFEKIKSTLSPVRDRSKPTKKQEKEDKLSNEESSAVKQKSSVDKMKKAELVQYAADLVDEPEDALKLLTKTELKDLIS